MNFDRMRALLLEHAIQGKLVPQLAEEGGVEQIGAVPQKIPFGIPDTWKWVQLGSVVNVQSSKRVHKADWRSEGIPFYRAREIVTLSKYGKVDNDLFVEEDFYNSLNGEDLPVANDLMVSAVGTLGAVYVVKEGDRFYYKDASVLCFKNLGFIAPYFLKLVIDSPYFKHTLKEASSGTTVGTLTIKNAKNFLIPYPPLQEQRRIVAKIEESFAEIDRAEKAYEELQTLAGVLRGQILQEAIQGKLVPQLAEEGGVEQIGSEPENEPFAIPESWKWLRVKDLAISVSTGPFGSMLHKSDYVEEGIPVVNPMNLVDGQIVPKRGMMVSTETADRLKTYQLKQGNIVVARRGELGRCAVVSADSDGWLCGTGSFFISLKDAVVPEYFAMCFGAKYMVFHLNSKSVGTTMANLNHGILKAAIIPVPPIREQIRILAKVANLMRQVDALSPR